MSIQLFIPSICSDPVVLFNRKPDEPSSDSLLFTATGQIYRGECAEIYRGTVTGGGLDDKDVVCKLVYGSHDVQSLAREARIYRSKLQQLQGGVVPRCHGYFEGVTPQKGLTACLVLEHAGRNLGGFFSEYERSFRHNLFQALVKIHKAGVAHWYICEENVLQSPSGEPVIIDFKVGKEETCKMPSDYVYEPDIVAPSTGCPELCIQAVNFGFWKPTTMVHWGMPVSVSYLSDPEGLALLSPETCNKVEALNSAFTSIKLHYRDYYPERYDYYADEIEERRKVYLAKLIERLSGSRGPSQSENSTQILPLRHLRAPRS
ncbi:hypothetical protein OF83DRAFT_1098863 [Amylostereum chailletii]|nr:hypothetical protein OF83DRAFT_1098863 [Amylostereum chailletii]